MLIGLYSKSYLSGSQCIKLLLLIWASRYLASQLVPYLTYQSAGGLDIKCCNGTGGCSAATS